MDYFPLLAKLQPNFNLIIPFKGFEKELENELIQKNELVILKTDAFIIIENRKFVALWGQDHWNDCKIYHFNKTNEHLKVLKSQPTLGVYYSAENNKIASKIKTELQSLKLKPIEYKISHPFKFNYFCWTMLGEFLITGHSKNQFPLGIHEFIENKDTPPNRAYLKLWEIFSLYKLPIKPNQTVIELGASPGGWSWVLSDIFQKVYAVDRADLAPQIKKIKNIQVRIGDAFGELPSNYPDVDWLFSDIICTPERLLSFVKMWLETKPDLNLVCTIKFKGETPFAIINDFLKIDHSRVVHLYHNKNEMTWIRLAQPYNHGTT